MKNEGRYKHGQYWNTFSCGLPSLQKTALIYRKPSDAYDLKSNMKLKLII